MARSLVLELPLTFTRVSSVTKFLDCMCCNLVSAMAEALVAAWRITKALAQHRKKLVPLTKAAIAALTSTHNASEGQCQIHTRWHTCMKKY